MKREKIMRILDLQDKFKKLTDTENKLKRPNYVALILSMDPNLDKIKIQNLFCLRIFDIELIEYLENILLEIEIIREAKL